MNPIPSLKNKTKLAGEARGLDSKQGAAGYTWPLSRIRPGVEKAGKDEKRKLYFWW